MKNIKDFSQFINENIENELKVGIQVEYEHTKKVLDHEEATTKATQIAKDHLKENPKYYSNLYKCGIIDEPAALKLAKELLT